MIISLFSFFAVFAIRDLYRMFFSSSCSLVIHAHTHIGNNALEISKHLLYSIVRASLAMQIVLSERKWKSGYRVITQTFEIRTHGNRESR